MNSKLFLDNLQISFTSNSPKLVPSPNKPNCNNTLPNNVSFNLQ